MVEIFEWEVFVAEDGGDRLGPCGTNGFQATAMDQLRAALRGMDPRLRVWGRITKRFGESGTPAKHWLSSVIFRADVDPAGSVRWTRQDL